MAKLGQYNLDEMSAQEAFEASAIHLLEQSEKSREKQVLGPSCLYNGNGLCCTAAIFIQGYEEKFENINWLALVKHHNQSDNHKALVGNLQGVHDGDDVGYWKGSLKHTGRTHGLDTSFLEDWVWNAEEQKYTNMKEKDYV